MGKQSPRLSTSIGFGRFSVAMAQTNPCLSEKNINRPGNSWGKSLHSVHGHSEKGRSPFLLVRDTASRSSEIKRLANGQSLTCRQGWQTPLTGLARHQGPFSHPKLAGQTALQFLCVCGGFPATPRKRSPRCSLFIPCALECCTGLVHVCWLTRVLAWDVMFAMGNKESERAPVIGICTRPQKHETKTGNSGGPEALGNDNQASVKQVCLNPTPSLTPRIKWAGKCLFIEIRRDGPFEGKPQRVYV